MKSNLLKETLNLRYLIIVFSLALPVIAQQLISACAQLVDNIMIGSLGVASINGVGGANQIFFVVLLLGLGIGEGTSILLSQQHGAKAHQTMRHTFATGMIFTIVIGISTTIIIYIFREQLLSIYLQTSSELAAGTEYLEITLLSYFFVLFNVLLGSGNRVVGEAKIPLVAGGITIILNTILNLFLIYGIGIFPELGVKGAAIATVISRIVETILLIYLTFKAKSVFWAKTKDYMTLKIKSLRELSITTLPLMGNEILWGLGMATLASFYAVRSSEAYSSYLIADSTNKILFVVISGFSVAVAILIGRRLGANETQTVVHEGDKLRVLSIFVGIATGIIGIIVAQIIPAFYDVTTEIRTTATLFIIVYSLYLPIACYVVAHYFIIRAGGKIFLVFVFDSVFVWVVQVPIAFYLLAETEINVVICLIIIQSAEIIKAILGTLVYKKKYWINNLVKE